MTGKTFEVRLLSRQKPLWEGQCSQVEVPALGGGLTFLAGHASCLVLLSKGEVKVKGEEDLAFSVEGGFAAFDHNHLVVAVDKSQSDRSSRISSKGQQG